MNFFFFLRFKTHNACWWQIDVDQLRQWPILRPLAVSPRRNIQMAKQWCVAHKCWIKFNHRTLNLECEGGYTHDDDVHDANSDNENRSFVVAEAAEVMRHLDYAATDGCRVRGSFIYPVSYKVSPEETLRSNRQQHITGPLLHDLRAEQQEKEDDDDDDSNDDEDSKCEKRWHKRHKQQQEQSYIVMLPFSVPKDWSSLDTIRSRVCVRDMVRCTDDGSGLLEIKTCLLGHLPAVLTHMTIDYLITNMVDMQQHVSFRSMSSSAKSGKHLLEEDEEDDNDDAKNTVPSWVVEKKERTKKKETSQFPLLSSKQLEQPMLAQCVATHRIFALANSAKGADKFCRLIANAPPVSVYTMRDHWSLCDGGFCLAWCHTNQSKTNRSRIFAPLAIHDARALSHFGAHPFLLSQFAR